MTTRSPDRGLVFNPRTWTVVQWIGAAVAVVGAVGYLVGWLL